MHAPDMVKVRKLAKKWGIKGEIRESGRKDKKLKVLHDGKWIHFGHPGYEDFTLHNDERRRERYCSRSSKITDKRGSVTGNDRSSPNYYAMRLLWDCAP